MRDQYTHQTKAELRKWQLEMQKKPTLINSLTSKMQDKINAAIPEKFHQVITNTIKQMIRAVLTGAGFVTSKPKSVISLKETEIRITEKIKWYRNTAAAEGGVTGAGGFLLALADFPMLIGIKMKMLFDIANTYGFDTNEYKERLYILHIFELAFCSHRHRNKVYAQMTDWKLKAAELPDDINQFDWRSFQQQYRDYIDLAKMAQLIPVIGAAVGLVVNYRLLKKLGHTAMNAYRMRLQSESEIFNN